MVGAGDYVELCVRDSGVGMSAASISRAFEPFFAARELPASTDLSLPLVRNLVAHALGHVWIESEPGAGTAFHVLFPRHDESRASSAPPDLFTPAAAPPPRPSQPRSPAKPKPHAKSSNRKGARAAQRGRVRRGPARG
jgi:hypothetical protein